MSTRLEELTSRLSGEAGSFIKGSGGLMAINVLAQLGAYLAQAGVARLIDEASYGIYDYAFSWFTIFLVGAVLGFDVSLVRFIPAYMANGDVASVRAVAAYARRKTAQSSTIIGAIFGFVAWILPLNSELTWALIAASVMLPLWAYHSVDRGILQAFHSVQVSAVMGGLVRPIVWVAGLFVMVRFLGIAPSGGAAVAAHCIALVVIIAMAAYVRKVVVGDAIRAAEENPPAELAHHDSKRWLKTSISLSLISGLHLVFQRIDVLVGGAIIGTTASGFYSVGSRLSVLMIFGLTSASAVAAPLISTYYERGETRSLERVAQLTAIVATPIAGVIGLIVFLARDFLLGVYGPEFVQASNVVVVLGGAAFLASIAGPVGFMLYMTGHEGVGARILVIVLILNLILNYPMVKMYGFIGAAYVTGALDIVKTIWMWVEVKRRVGIDASVFGMLRRT